MRDVVRFGQSEVFGLVHRGRAGVPDVQRPRSEDRPHPVGFASAHARECAPEARRADDGSVTGLPDGGRNRA